MGLSLDGLCVAGNSGNVGHKDEEQNDDTQRTQHVESDEHWSRRTLGKVGEGVTGLAHCKSWWRRGREGVR